MRSDREVEAYRDELKTNPYYQASEFLVERFIEGPEFTMFVAGTWRRPDTVWGFPPAQRQFHDTIHSSEQFLSYDRYWGLYREESPPPAGEPFYWYEACPPESLHIVSDLGKRAFCAVHGHGYGRVDLRYDKKAGEYYVLEVNANCGISSDDQTSVGNILRIAGVSFSDLVGRLIEDALAHYHGM